MFIDEDTIRLELEEVMDRFGEYISTLRTGKPNPEAIGKIIANYYGAPTPLKQMASITNPEPTQILISLFDKSNDTIDAVEKALSQSDIASNFSNEGGGKFYVRFPPMTEEIRKATVKQLNEELEKKYMTRIKHIRQEEMKKLKDLTKVPEDEVKRDEEKVQKIYDEYSSKIKKLAEEKEKDIMAV